MKFLSDPTRLKPVDKKDGLLQVIVETPAGSRNKFAFDPKQGIFALKKVLPAGMVFPYDFGFYRRQLPPTMIRSMSCCSWMNRLFQVVLYGHV
jgi:inorganic pyrophosphatase